MDRTTKTRDRTGMFQIVLIAAVLLAALYGGLRLLASTHDAWAARKSTKAAYADAVSSAQERAAAKAQAARAEERLRKLSEAREQQKADLESGKLRCINGQVFERLDNGWANLPGQHCQ